MKTKIVLRALLLAGPAGAGDVLELSVAQGDPVGSLRFCTLSTRPDDTSGYAILILRDHKNNERAVGMSPAEEAPAFGELNPGTVRHICAAGGAHELVVAVDLEQLQSLREQWPTKKNLRTDSAHSGSHDAMLLARGMVESLGLKKGYSYIRAQQGAERSIHFFRDLLVLNRPPATPTEETSP